MFRKGSSDHYSTSKLSNRKGNCDHISQLIAYWIGDTDLGCPVWNFCDFGDRQVEFVNSVYFKKNSLEFVASNVARCINTKKVLQFQYI